MTLLQSWADSLQLLKPKNLQLFLMVTLKSIIETYKLMFSRFWPLIVLLVVWFLIPYLFPAIPVDIPEDTIFGISHTKFNTFVRSVAFLGSYMTHELWFLLVCFATRPSITRKDPHYFFNLQLKKIYLYWLFIPCISWSSGAYYGYIFTVLFFADSDGGPKNFFRSIWNAIKMIIFNFPLVIPIGAVFYGVGLIGRQFIEPLFMPDSPVIQMVGHLYTLQGFVPYPQFFIALNLISALLLPICVCTFANIYIKRLHDQFDLYVKQPQ